MHSSVYLLTSAVVKYLKFTSGDLAAFQKFTIQAQSLVGLLKNLGQGSLNSVLEGHCPAEFSSNPN